MNSGTGFVCDPCSGTGGVRPGHRPRSDSGGPTDRTMELDAMDRISRVERRKVCAHSCRRDQQRSSRSLLGILRLAEQADTPELREKLLNLAREWMRAVMTTSP